MIAKKRLEEIRAYARAEITRGKVTDEEVERLVECYEAAQAWAKHRSDFLNNETSASYVMMNEAGDRLRDIFAEVAHG